MKLFHNQGHRHLGEACTSASCNRAVRVIQRRAQQPTSLPFRAPVTSAAQTKEDIHSQDKQQTETPLCSKQIALNANQLLWA